MEGEAQHDLRRGVGVGGGSLQSTGVCSEEPLSLIFMYLSPLVAAMLLSLFRHVIQRTGLVGNCSPAPLARARSEEPLSF